MVLLNKFKLAINKCKLALTLNRFKLAFTLEPGEVRLSKTPIIVGVILVYLSTLIASYTYKFTVDTNSGVAIVMTINLLIFVFSDNIFKHKYWLYFVIQGIFIFDYPVIMPKGNITILLGLVPVLIFQSILVYRETIKVVTASCFIYGIFCGTIITFDGVKVLLQYIPILIIITIAVRAYSIIFLQQVKSRIETQKILQELEFAYEKVEELTLVNERQRVARDLHDTLSQGIAGIIMQLEAIHANLNNNNTKRAQEIVEKAMEHARKTLADSRLVIDDLRLQTNTDIDIEKAIENEIAAFKNVSNTSVEVDIKVASQIPYKISKHILYIVREALNNIAKHANAKNAVVEIAETNDQININITDDGIGFDVKLLDQLFGHYGLLGMTERTRAMDGKIKIKSKRKAGTNIHIIIPMEKGIVDQNE